VDEIKLFEQLRPPPPPDAARMREAARARLAAATGAPLAHPARRRSTVVAVAAAGALVAAGAGYGITDAQGGSSHLPSGSSRLLTTAAGLTAVNGCPGKYVTAGTLKKVIGTQAVIQPATGRLVTVATSPAAVITRPVSGTVSDITDGSQVTVQGTWSGRRLAATQVGIEAGLPAPGSIGPRLPRHRGNVPALFKLRPPKGVLPPPLARGKVVNAHDGSFTVIMRNAIPGVRRVQVITSHATKVLMDASTSLSQLDIGANVVAVGQIGSDESLTASTVTEPPGGRIMIGGGLVRLRTSGCSASAIMTAAILASG
jgi:hypothetical protein